jgi:hypothetical protein
MIIDFNSCEDGARLEADLCIVGGGMSGLTIARSLLGTQLRILVVETGGLVLENVIRLGFGNHYKLGCWTPAYVELSGALGDSGAPGRFDIEAPDGDDVPAWFIGPRIIWTEGSTRTEYVRIGRPNSQLKVRLTKLGTAEEPPSELLAGASTPTDAVALPATNELIVQFGASIGLPEMFRRLELPEVERADVVTIDRRRQ